MTLFEMIKYHNQDYPSDVPLRTEEVAAHFDIEKISGKLDRSLHTEYSYGKRNFTSKVVSRYKELVAARKKGVPQLWKSSDWALQFADFVFSLNDTAPAPRVIEVHPPFDDYTDLNGFLKSYSLFERCIKERYPDVEILIENRCGSVYHGGKFLISKLNDLQLLCDGIQRENLQLRIAFDIPQIYTAHNAKFESDFIKIIEKTKQIREYIGGVHLWGKRLSQTGRKVAHHGDLNSYFGDENVKKHFLDAFCDCFDDSVVRKMVLEVNSGNEDLLSIVSDLKNAGIRFV